MLCLVDSAGTVTGGYLVSLVEISVVGGESRIKALVGSARGGPWHLSLTVAACRSKQFREDRRPSFHKPGSVRVRRDSFLDV